VWPKYEVHFDETKFVVVGGSTYVSFYMYSIL
jgi:hypothetical protein